MAGKKGRTGTSGKSPVIGSNGINVKEGDNAKISQAISEIMSWGKPSSLSNVQELEDRLQRYLTYCYENDVRISNLAAYMACGLNKVTVSHWENEVGGTREQQEFVHKLKAICGVARELTAAHGGTHPTLAIWWQKIYEGYDETQHVVIDNYKTGLAGKEELERKFIDLFPDEPAKIEAADGDRDYYEDRL